MRSTIYHLCRSPRIYNKLLAELDAFHAAGKLSPFITYAEAIKLPYTMATIKEAMRVYPSIPMTFPRHVPKGGAVISGKFFPEGVCWPLTSSSLEYISLTCQKVPCGSQSLCSPLSDFHLRSRCRRLQSRPLVSTWSSRHGSLYVSIRRWIESLHW